MKTLILNDEIPNRLNLEELQASLVAAGAQVVSIVDAMTETQADNSVIYKKPVIQLSIPDQVADATIKAIATNHSPSKTTDEVRASEMLAQEVEALTPVMLELLKVKSISDAIKALIPK